MLILHDLTAMHWALSGALIATITLLLLFTTNRRLGISTAYESVCGMVSRLPYFQRPTLKGRGTWRLPFLGGLLLGGVLSAVLAGGWSPIWDMGMWDAEIGGGPLMKLVWVYVGGVLIGVGTRISSGCTSGHGIFGLSNLERGSLMAVLAFMASGIVTANLIYRVIF